MRRSIVVVEDDESLASVIAESLEDAGYPVVSFTRTEGALRFLEAEEASLVLTDLHLVGMDGWALIEWLRQRPGTAAPVVVMTGTVLCGDLDVRPPVRAILMKPFELNALVEMVSRWATD